jgi:hypothetical protein
MFHWSGRLSALVLLVGVLFGTSLGFVVTYPQEAAGISFNSPEVFCLAQKQTIEGPSLKTNRRRFVIPKTFILAPVSLKCDEFTLDHLFRYLNISFHFFIPSNRLFLYHECRGPSSQTIFGMFTGPVVFVDELPVDRMNNESIRYDGYIAFIGTGKVEVLFSSTGDWTPYALKRRGVIGVVIVNSVTRTSATDSVSYGLSFI